MTFKPHTPLKDIVAAVVDPSHPRFGQFGDLTYHDWRDLGGMGVRFPDRLEEQFNDESGQLLLLLRPLEIVDRAHPRYGQIGRFAMRGTGIDASVLLVEFEDKVQERVEEDQIRRAGAAEMPHLIRQHPWLGKPPRETDVSKDRMAGAHR